MPQGKCYGISTYKRWDFFILKLYSRGGVHAHRCNLDLALSYTYDSQNNPLIVLKMLQNASTPQSGEN